MKRFFDTVSPEWKSSLADEIARCWFPGGAAAYCLRASANFVFIVKRGEENYYLRFNHENERTTAFIQAEMDYLEYLATQGIRANRPIRSTSSLLVESVATEMGIFHAVLLTAMSGKQYALEDMDDVLLEQWGQALGRLHAAGAGPFAANRPDWHDHLRFVREMLPTSEIAARREMDSVETTLACTPVNTENYGLIHFDFEQDNLCWDNNDIGIIDFDDCARSWFAADIAYALRDLYGDHLDRLDTQDEGFQTFLHGYRKEKNITATDLSLLPALVRLHNLYLCARIYRSIAERPQGSEPQWTADLRAKLQRMVDSYLLDFEKHPLKAFQPPKPTL